MIFDGHAYTFPPLNGPGGFSDPDALRRHLQQAIAVHHQPELPDSYTHLTLPTICSV